MNAGRLQSAVAMSIAVRKTFSNREILLVEVYHQLNWKSLNDTYLNQVNYMCITCTRTYNMHSYILCPLLVDITGYVSELYRSKASSHSSTCNVKQQTDVACTCCCGLLVFTLSLSLLSVSSPFSTVGLLVQGGEYCARPFSRNLTCLHEIWI